MMSFSYEAYIAKVSIQNFDISMNDFQHNELVLVLTDTSNEKETGISLESLTICFIQVSSHTCRRYTIFWSDTNINRYG